MIRLLLFTINFFLLVPVNAKALTLGFGSCSKQYKELSYLEDLANEALDVFIFLGDNVYADTDDEKDAQSLPTTQRASWL